MKHFVVIVGVLALLAMGKAQEEEGEVTTEVPPDDSDDSVRPPLPPLPPLDPYYPLRPPIGPPRRHGPPGVIGQGHQRRFGPFQFDEGNRNIPGPFGGPFGGQQQFGPFDRRQGQQQLGNSQRLPFGVFGNSQSQRPFGFGFDFQEDRQQSGPFGGRQRQQFQGNLQPQSPFGFSEGAQQQPGLLGERQRQQQQGPLGNRFGPPQFNDIDQYVGFRGSYPGPGSYQQQQQQLFRRFPQREPVFFDFGSNNDFGRRNIFDGIEKQRSTTASYDEY